MSTVHLSESLLKIFQIIDDLKIYYTAGVEVQPWGTQLPL